MWTIPRMWENETCIVIGGGASVPRQFDVPESIIQNVFRGNLSPAVYSPYMASIHNEHIIAVNMAFKLGSWIDVLFFGDGGFWKKNKDDILSFNGLRVTCATEEDTNYFGKVHRVYRDPKVRQGISTRSGCISWNHNSGAAAINFAVHTGVKRIILLGFDMKLDSDNNQHWHKFYAKKSTSSANELFKVHRKGFVDIANALKGKVEIINACPDSTIVAFPKMDFKSIILDSKLPTEDVFTTIYEKRLWKSSESVSGTGSELKSTVNIRKQIPHIFTKYGIKRVLDVGCGDFNWMQKIANTFEYYLGIDVVKLIIQQNISKYQTDSIQFKHNWIGSMYLEPYNFDVIILSDVLVHLSFNDIKLVLQKIAKSGIKYVLMTHFTGISENKDIVTGGWRPIRWDLPPFNLISPLEVIQHSDEQDRNATSKTLSLWEV